MAERPILFSGPMVRAILDGRKTMTRRVVNFDNLRLIPRHTIGSDFPFRNNYGHVIAGRKTKVKMNQYGAVCGKTSTGEWLGLKPGEFDFVCPYGDGKTKLIDGKWHIVNDEDATRLWVRETFGMSRASETKPADEFRFKEIRKGNWSYAFYKASLPDPARYRWKPSIHMPRWASRITLEITNIRVERVQEISRADAKQEGFWPSELNGLESWDGRLYGNANDAFKACWDSIYLKHGFGWHQNPWVWVITFKKL